MNNFDKYSDVNSRLIINTGENSEALTTFLIPTYNRYDKLFRALDSINQQKHNKYDYNIVVVDNNSDFSVTEEFLDKLREYHNLCYYINETNIGMFGNWNRGIQLVNTKYISMLHDDDTISTDYLGRMHTILKRLKNKNVGYIKTAAMDVLDVNPPKKRKIRLYKRILKGIFNKRVIKLNKSYVDYVGDLGYVGAPSCGSILLKNAFIELGGYNEDYYPSSDVYPLINMIDKYEIYETYGFFGYRYFGENESCKFETMTLWYKNILNIMNLLSYKSLHGKRTISKYKNEQLYIYIDNLKVLPLPDGRKIDIDDFKDIYEIKISKYRLFKLKVIKRILVTLSVFRAIIWFK